MSDITGLAPDPNKELNTEPVPVGKDRMTVVRKEDRESIWFLGDFVQLIVTGEHTDGRFVMAYHESHPSSQPPLHEHENDDEIFVILDGQITFWALDQEVTLGAGDTIVLPKHVPHTFQVSADKGAKWLVLLSPSGFENFWREVGEKPTHVGPIEGWKMDEATEERLNTSAKKNGITLIAPPGTLPAEVDGADRPNK